MRRSCRLTMGGIAVGALAMIAGCGSTAIGTGGSPGGGAGTSPNGGGTSPNVPNACTILTSALAASLTGVTSLTNLTPAAASQNTLSTCVYGDTTGSSGGNATLLIEHIPGTTASVQAVMQSVLSNSAKTSDQPQTLSGPWDAGFKNVGSMQVAIGFVKGNTFVVLAAGGSRDGASVETDLETLAHQVAGQV